MYKRASLYNQKTVTINSSNLLTSYDQEKKATSEDCSRGRKKIGFRQHRHRHRAETVSQSVNQSIKHFDFLTLRGSKSQDYTVPRPPPPPPYSNTLLWGAFSVDTGALGKFLGGRVRRRARGRLQNPLAPNGTTSRF